VSQEICSYCGEKGHGIQQCPKWKGKQEVATAKREPITITVSERREKEVFENVNALEFFPANRFADVYVAGKKHRIPYVISILWSPYISPRELTENLPVTLFKTDTLSTDIQFKPSVKVRYDPIRMELTILWALTASSSDFDVRYIDLTTGKTIKKTIPEREQYDLMKLQREGKISIIEIKAVK